MALETNLSRAEEVVTKLYSAFTRRAGVFADTKELLENQIPLGVTSLSLEHACFLFYLISNDYGTKSAVLYEKAKRLYVEDPTLFSPHTILERFSGPEDADLIKNTGSKLGTRFPLETAKRWYFNSEKLWHEYAGDPRSIFTSSSQAKQVFNRIREFRGFGPKIGGLLLRTFLGCGFAHLENLEEVLVPVDIHDTRIAFWTEAVCIPGSASEIENYHRYAQNVQQVWSEACRVEKLDWLEVDRALWILGSKGCVKLLCEFCVLNRLCRVGTKQMASRLIGAQVDDDTE